jgi:hypothetical protein
MDDQELERRMRDWQTAEAAARDAERAAVHSPVIDADAVESPVQHAARLRRLADAILASILEDMRVRRTTLMPVIHEANSEAHAP